VLSSINFKIIRVVLARLDPKHTSFGSHGPSVPCEPLPARRLVATTQFTNPMLCLHQVGRFINRNVLRRNAASDAGNASGTLGQTVEKGLSSEKQQRSNSSHNKVSHIGFAIADVLSTNLRHVSEKYQAHHLVDYLVLEVNQFFAACLICASGLAAGLVTGVVGEVVRRAAGQGYA